MADSIEGSQTFLYLFVELFLYYMAVNIVASAAAVWYYK